MAQPINTGAGLEHRSGACPRSRDEIDFVGGLTAERA
jgi:hypothetical protein